MTPRCGTPPGRITLVKYMGKPPNLIMELGERPNIDHEKEMAEHGAPPKAAKAMYIAIIVTLVVLFALVAIGLHIPTGG
jgi:hypothetical protein